MSLRCDPLPCGLLPRPPPLQSAAAAQPQRYLTNDEAAEYLRLSPRTGEAACDRRRPALPQFGRRVMYAVADDAWAD